MPLRWSTRAPIEHLSERGPSMAPGNKPAIQRMVAAAFVVTIAWLATARADDILDKGVSFHISASPLSSALIEFSTQSGIQVAAADADVAQLNSNGVNGTYPIRAALSTLLHGTGLEFSRVGAETVAIRTASAGAAPEIPDVTVTAPRPPTDQELAGDGLYQFIVHHATVHYFDTGARGNL